MTTQTSVDLSKPPSTTRATLRRNAWLVGPAYIALAILLVIGFFINHSFDSAAHLGNLVLLASFLIVVGFGQGITMLTGGIDISIPYTMTMAAILVSKYAQTDHGSHTWLLLWPLGVCVLIGVANGLGIAVLKLPPIVMTLAMNTILTGIVLVLTSGSPGGSSPKFLTALMSDRVFGALPIVAIPLAAFVAAGIIVLARTTFGRRVYAVGNSARVARLSGINVNWITVCVYAVSGLCSGIAGLMLLGFAKQSFIGMGDAYLLPSIAAVVIGGTSALGGRGIYLGTVGGALLLEALTTVSGALFQSAADQDIVYGIIILLAMVAVRAK